MTKQQVYVGHWRWIQGTTVVFEGDAPTQRDMDEAFPTGGYDGYDDETDKLEWSTEDIEPADEEEEEEALTN